MFLRPFKPKEIKKQEVAEIQFLGVWDTVDAYGLPVEELKTGIDQYIWPLRLDDRTKDERILKACHALSMDDKRTTFQPLLWDENFEEVPQDKHTDEENLTQVWFAGAHANVGGGYPDDSLSFVSLNWMIETAAKKKGLKVYPEAVAAIRMNANSFGRIYDFRRGLAAYYRYAPRRLEQPNDKQGAVISHPKIHESVVWRMAIGTDNYAPLSSPHKLRIVADNDQDVRSGSKTRAKSKIAKRIGPKKRNIFGFDS